MVSPVRASVAVALLLIAVFAGCITPKDKATPAATVLPTVVDGVLPVAITNAMNFTASVVKPAVAVASDLYEPTVEVSDTGAIYATAHVIGAATTGSPGYVSTDGGKTWTQLPFVASV